jgi:hypothetical protein
MSCVGCNDGCFDESVQLAQGPVGPAGAAGAEGSTTVNAGSNISVTGTGTSGDPYVVNFTGTNGDHNVLFTDINQEDVTNSTYGAAPNDPVVSLVINGTTQNINGIGDIIRFNFMLIGDYAVDSFSSYDFKISFGGQTILDTSVSTVYQLRKNFSWGKLGENATKVSLDLIVSAANTLTPVFNQIKSFGDRSAKIMIGEPSYYNTVLSSISVSDLSSNNTLELSIKSSDGTSNISFMFCEVIKLLKA